MVPCISHTERGSRKVSSLKTTESYVKYGHLSFVFRKQEMIWPISCWLECERWIWDSGERFTTQNKKTCTPPLKVGQEIAQLSTWSEREQEVPKGWEFVRNWPVIKGFVENLERIRISLRAEGSESKIKAISLLEKNGEAGICVFYLLELLDIPLVYLCCNVSNTE